MMTSPPSLARRANRTCLPRAQNLTLLSRQARKTLNPTQITLRSVTPLPPPPSTPSLSPTPNFFPPLPPVPPTRPTFPQHCDKQHSYLSGCSFVTSFGRRQMLDKNARYLSKCSALCPAHLSRFPQHSNNRHQSLYYLAAHWLQRS